MHSRELHGKEAPAGCLSFDVYAQYTPIALHLKRKEVRDEGG